MNVTHMRKQLKSYIETADNRKVKAMYTMLENEISTTSIEWVQEIEIRANEMETGKVVGVPWSEVMKQSQNTLAKTKGQ